MVLKWAGRKTIGFQLKTQNKTELYKVANRNGGQGDALHVEEKRLEAATDKKTFNKSRFISIDRTFTFYYYVQRTN